MVTADDIEFEWVHVQYAETGGFADVYGFSGNQGMVNLEGIRMRRCPGARRSQLRRAVADGGAQEGSWVQCILRRRAPPALDRSTQRLAELMMDAAVGSAIRGKTMDAADEELGEEVTAPHPMARAEFK